MSRDNYNPFHTNYEAFKHDTDPSEAKLFLGTGLTVGGLATLGSTIYLHSDQESYLAHSYILENLNETNNNLHAQYSEMPPMVKMSVDGVALKSQIDTTQTAIHQEKYNYEGGMTPGQLTSASLALGAIAGVLAASFHIQLKARNLRRR